MKHNRLDLCCSKRLVFELVQLRTDSPILAELFNHKDTLRKTTNVPHIFRIELYNLSDCCFAEPDQDYYIRARGETLSFVFKMVDRPV